MTKLPLISAILLVGVLQSRAQTDAQLRDPEYLVDQYNQLVAKHNALIEKTRDLIQNQSKKIISIDFRINYCSVGFGRVGIGFAFGLTYCHACLTSELIFHSLLFDFDR